MSANDLLTLIDAEIAKLQQARALIARNPKPLSTAVPAWRRDLGVAKPKQLKRRKMSPEGRARIAAAQKARWAAKKKAEK